MTLDPSYLDYPNRRHGMDHDIYPWSNLFERPKIVWPDGAKIALWVVPCLEYFPLTVVDKPWKAPGHMQTPYPDMRYYTSRDYGNRVGFYRFLKLFDRYGVKASVSMQSRVAERYPEIMRDCVSRGYEIIAHSTDANGIQFGGMGEEAERALIAETVSSLERSSGQKIRGWHSIAKSQSEHTLALLNEAGLDYACDWVNDDMPYVQKAGSGSLWAMPLTQEISDRQIISTCLQGDADYVEQVIDQFDLLYREATTHGGRILALTLTPYIMGLPYRIKALEKVIKHVMSHEGVWSATGAEILDCVRAQGGSHAGEA